MDQLPTWLIIIILLLGASAATGLVTFLTAAAIRGNTPIRPSIVPSESPATTPDQKPASEITFIEEKRVLPSHPDNPKGGANPLSARTSGARRRAQ